LNKTVTALPTARPGFDASHLTDGNTALSSTGGFWGGSITSPESQIGSFAIDLGQQTDGLFKVIIYPANPASLPTLRAKFKVVIADQNNAVVWDSASAGYPVMSTFGGNPLSLTLPRAVSGRYVTLQGVTVGSLQMAEVQVYKDNGPTITMSGQSAVIGSVGQSLSTYDSGATAVDVTGSSTPVTVTYAGTNGTVSASTQLADGQSYTITYTATDSYGITSTTSRTVEAIIGTSAANTTTSANPYGTTQ